MTLDNLTPVFWLAAVFVAVIAYLLGSINSAVIVSYFYAKDDVRKHGSGNAGMTNILRTYGKIPALITAIGDVGKGMLAVIIARLIFGAMGAVFMDGGYIGGFFAIIGHLFPIYFGFKGGKGILTSFGIILILEPVVALILILILVPFVFIVKIVSLTSLIGAILFPILTCVVSLLAHKPAVFNTFFALLIGGMIVYMHRENIKRLCAGTEHRFGQNKSSEK